MFTVCGEALWDLFAAPGDDFRQVGFDARIGGSPFNVAVGLARLGCETALCGGLSTDRLGARLDAALAAEGVSRDLLVRVPNRSTISLVDLGEDGGPSYAFYGEGAADRALERAPELPDACWGVHFGSFSTIVTPCGPVFAGMAEREAGRRLVTYDPNVRLNVEPDVALWRDNAARFAAAADLVKVSAEDLGLLWPGRGVEDAVAAWRAAGARLVVVTDGGAGAAAWGAFGTARTPGRKVQVADTVGAGDSFMAALIAGLDRRGARDRAALDALDAGAVSALLEEAAAAAAITVSRAGANPPTRDELRAAL